MKWQKLWWFKSSTLCHLCPIMLDSKKSPSSTASWQPVFKCMRSSKEIQGSKKGSAGLEAERKGIL